MENMLKFHINLDQDFIKTPNAFLELFFYWVTITSTRSFLQNKVVFLDATIRGGSRAVATSKMECFAIIVTGWKPLTIITKRSILDVAAVLDPPLIIVFELD